MCLILAFLCSCVVLQNETKNVGKIQSNLVRNMRQKCPQIHFIKFLKLMMSKIFFLFEQLKILTKTIAD